MVKMYENISAFVNVLGCVFCFIAICNIVEIVRIVGKNNISGFDFELVFYIILFVFVMVLSIFNIVLFNTSINKNRVLSRVCFYFSLLFFVVLFGILGFSLMGVNLFHINETEKTYILDNLLEITINESIVAMINTNILIYLVIASFFVLFSSFILYSIRENVKDNSQ